MSTSTKTAPAPADGDREAIEIAEGQMVLTPPTGTNTGPRLHRATCRKAMAMHGVRPLSQATAAQILLSLQAVATCCKPNRTQVGAVQHYSEMRAAADEHGYRMEHDDEYRARVLIEESKAAAQGEASIPAIGATSAGTGELAGGDVQALPRTRKPRTRTATRHDQRTPLPGDEVAAEAAVTDTQKCIGACGRTLPLVKFPTMKRAGEVVRGHECRECRDKRRDAAKK